MSVLLCRAGALARGKSSVESAGRCGYGCGFLVQLIGPALPARRSATGAVGVVGGDCWRWSEGGLSRYRHSGWLLVRAVYMAAVRGRRTGLRCEAHHSSESTSAASVPTTLEKGRMRRRRRTGRQGGRGRRGAVAAQRADWLVVL